MKKRNWVDRRREEELHRSPPTAATIKNKAATAVQEQTVEEEGEVAVLEEMSPMARRGTDGGDQQLDSNQQKWQEQGSSKGNDRFHSNSDDDGEAIE